MELLSKLFCALGEGAVMSAEDLHKGLLRAVVSHKHAPPASFSLALSGVLLLCANRRRCRIRRWMLRRAQPWSPS